MGDDPSNKGEDDPNPISVKDIQVAPTQAALQTHLPTNLVRCKPNLRCYANRPCPRNPRKPSGALLS